MCFASILFPLSTASKCPPFSVLIHRGISPSSRRQTPTSPPRSRQNTDHRHQSLPRRPPSSPLPPPQTQCQQNCGTDSLRPLPPPQSAAASSLSVGGSVPLQTSRPTAPGNGYGCQSAECRMSG